MAAARASARRLPNHAVCRDPPIASLAARPPCRAAPPTAQRTPAAGVYENRGRITVPSRTMVIGRPVLVWYSFVWSIPNA